MNRNIVYSLIIVCFFYNVGIAQVRIGGLTPPMAGALLDVNEDTSLSSKGMLMPRVLIKSMNSLDDINPKSVNRPDPALHIGLLVFGISDDATCPLFDPGVLVWSGEKWIPISKSKTDLDKIIENRVATLFYDTDQDGNVIIGKQYGLAGTWMIHNLAVKHYADGTPIMVYNGTSTTSPAYTFPNSKNGNTPSNYNNQQGLLYNWFAVTKGLNQTLDQGQSSALGTTPGISEVETISGNIQGICPYGWHIPSDREWTTLISELYSNPTIYSNYETADIPNSTVWDGNWSTNADVIQGVNTSKPTYGSGAIMKYACKVERSNSSMSNPVGYSKSLADGGFNAVLTGYVFSNFSLDYGNGAYFWTSSANSNAAYSRILTPSETGINKTFLSKNNLLSVRCKKD